MRSCELQPTETAPAGILADGDDFIRSRIFSVRGVQVMLDSDLAEIYQVETRVFNQSVKRNESRFPPNFRFRLSMEEYRSLISQIVTSKEERGETRGGRQKAPYVFTEQGLIMLVCARVTAAIHREGLIVKALSPAIFKMGSKSTTLNSGLCNFSHSPRNEIVARLRIQFLTTSFGSAGFFNAAMSVRQI